jgi:hypothetical protein
MALQKGENSYATVLEADTYFADRLDVVAWTSADSLTKAQALITAASILDDMSWTGSAISEDQPLAFPRTGSYFDPKVGSIMDLGDDIPVRIFKANIEMAHHLMNNDGLQDDTGNIKRIQVGPITIENNIRPSVLPPNVKRLVKPLMVNSGSHSWWRAN